MARYFTSDLHVGHTNIISYCSRPFTDTDQMNTVMVDTLNTVAGPGDELWILGDLAMGQIESTLPALACLTADVHLVAGNHDRCHPYNGAKHERFVDMYTEATGAASLTLTNSELVLDGGTRVLLSHFPYTLPDGAGVDKFARWRPIDDGSWLLCGHVHEKWRQRGRMINVGIDAWGGRPVSEAEILELIALGPADREIIPWV